MKPEDDDIDNLEEGSELEQYRAAFFDMMTDEQPVDIPNKARPSRLPAGYSYKPHEPNEETPQS